MLGSSISSLLKIDTGARIFIVHCDVFMMDMTDDVMWRKHEFVPSVIVYTVCSERVIQSVMTVLISHLNVTNAAGVEERLSFITGWLF